MSTSRFKPTLSRVSAILLILVGTFLPSATLMAMLRDVDQAPALRDDLLMGAFVFRMGLVVWGVLILLASRLDIWQIARDPDKGRLLPEGRGALAVFLLMMIAAVALRVFQLDAGLWHDELATYVKIVQSMTLGESISSYPSENQHFLFSLLARLSVLAFGEHNWALRLPAVLFGVGSIWATYLLGREIATEREGLLAAALMTFSYHHIWFSQNARGYTGLLFFTLLSTWLLIRGVREARPQVWIGFAVAVALGVFTQLTMLFVVVGQFAVYLIAIFAHRRPNFAWRWDGFVIGFVLSGLLTIQLHAFALPQMLHTVNETSTVPAWKNPLWTVLEIIDGLQVSFAFSFVAAIALIVFAVGVVSYLRSNWMLMVVFFVSTLLLATVMIVLGHHLWPRFFFYAMGFGALIAVRGVLASADVGGKLLRLSAQQRWWITTAGAGAMVLVSALSVPFVYGPKQDFGAALAFVQEHAADGDRVAVVGLAEFTYREFYKTDWVGVGTVDELNQVRNGARRTWLLYTFASEIEAVYPAIMRKIESDFKEIGAFPGTLRNGTVFVVRADGPPATASIPRRAPG